MVAGIASRSQLGGKLAQLQGPEIARCTEQSVRFPTDFVEIAAIEKAAYVADAFGGAEKKHVENLAQCLARHDIGDHLQASWINCEKRTTIGDGRRRPRSSPDVARGHIVKAREELHIIDRLR